VAEQSTSEREASEASEASAEERLPLTPAVFHILLALAGGERHGYAIMREVSEQTNGQMRLGPGTLYGSIRRMLGQGVIEETEARPDPTLDDERRRYYRLTPFGRRVAEAEAARLQALTRTAQARGLLPGAVTPGEPAGAGGLR
jgi:DNA-binding PadR family transcriptional regulator